MVSNKTNTKSIKKAAAAVCLLLAAYLALCACTADKTGTESALSPLEMAAVIAAGQGDGIPQLYTVSHADSEFKVYTQLYLGDHTEDVRDGVFCYPAQTNATEITIFQMNDEGAAEAVEESLLSYLKNRAGAFAGYAPEQAELAKKGVVLINGSFAAVIICPDADAARADFLRCFGEEPPQPDTAVLIPYNELQSETEPPEATTGPDTETTDPDTAETESPETEPPETESPEATDERYDYDPEKLLRAWRTEDTSALSEMDRKLLSACRKVIEFTVTPGMTELEKERAIHDWMIVHGDYDRGALDSLPIGEPDINNDNPYGFIIRRKGICLGYATTMQLFMDMLDIECITIRGYASDGEADHAWNKVRIDGTWYYVDVTWDDPVADFEVPAEYHYKYFNVSKEFMELTDHRWDGE